MTTLFIGNTTKQAHDFIFRMPENLRTISQRIEAGTQVRVLRDVSATDIDFVVKQHEKYGLTEQEEAAKTRGRFIGMVYSIDKPIKQKNMELVFKHNDGELTKTAERNLALQGEAINHNLNKVQQETTGRGSVQRTEVEVLEQGKPGGKPAEVALGTEVVRPGVEPRKGRQRRQVGK